MTQLLLEVKYLKTQFRTKRGIVTAMGSASFFVSQGDTLGIVGEFGRGKSVTSLSTLQPLPHAVGSVVGGEILYRGEDIAKKRNKEMCRIRGRKIPMIFQDSTTSLNPTLTVGRQLEETISVHSGLSKGRIKKQTLDILTKVGVSSPEQGLRELPHQLSGGMRQRVMIAMASSCSPSLLTADGLTTALGVTIQAQIIDLMVELKKNISTPIILTTHDTGVVVEMADYIMVIYAGKVTEYRSAEQIFKEAIHLYTQSLLTSIPRLDKDLDCLFSIDGTVPSLDRMPEGCRFCARCLQTMGRCREYQPPVYITGDGHKMSCWKYESLKEEEV